MRSLYCSLLLVHQWVMLPHEHTCRVSAIRDPLGNSKNIDREYLRLSLPAIVPENLIHIGVDEVARAKRHDYMTVVYDLVSVHLIWVEHGRKAEVLISFFEQLSEEIKSGIKSVSMDMGQSYNRRSEKCFLMPILFLTDFMSCRITVS